MANGSTPPNDSTVVQTLGCRWGWCRLTFSSIVDLNHHVIYQHVRKAKPVTVHDLSVLRRVQEGVGKSITFATISSGDDNGMASEDSAQSQCTPLQVDKNHDFFGFTPQPLPRDINPSENLKRTTPRPPRPASLQSSRTPIVPSTMHQDSIGDGGTLPTHLVTQMPIFRSLFSPVESTSLPAAFDSQVDVADQSENNEVAQSPDRYSRSIRQSINAEQVHSRPVSKSPQPPTQDNSQSSSTSPYNVEQKQSSNQDVVIDAIGQDICCGESHPKDCVSVLTSGQGQEESRNSPELQYRSFENGDGNVLLPPSTQLHSHGIQHSSHGNSQSQVHERSLQQLPELYTQVDVGWSQVRPLVESAGEAIQDQHPDSVCSAEPTQFTYPSFTESGHSSINHSRGDRRQSPGQDYVHVFRSGSIKIGSRSSGLSHSPVISTVGIATDEERSQPKLGILSRPVMPSSPSQNSQSSTGSVARTSPLSYLYMKLQTQAPYQSQSL